MERAVSFHVRLKVGLGSRWTVCYRQPAGWGGQREGGRIWAVAMRMGPLSCLPGRGAQIHVEKWIPPSHKIFSLIGQDDNQSDGLTHQTLQLLHSVQDKYIGTLSLVFNWAVNFRHGIFIFNINLLIWWYIYIFLFIKSNDFNGGRKSKITRVKLILTVCLLPDVRDSTQRARTNQEIHP